MNTFQEGMEGAKHTPNELCRAHLLVENAQPCGFVAGFDVFDLAFMVNKK
jgi:hypothetical protein